MKQLVIQRAMNGKKPLDILGHNNQSCGKKEKKNFYLGQKLPSTLFIPVRSIYYDQ
jgi:hypothetical protein